MADYVNAAQAAALDGIRALVTDGTLEIGTTGFAQVLTTHGLDATAGSVTNGTWTLVFDNNTVTSAATGTAAVGRIKNSGGTVIIDNMTVGTSGTEIVVSSTSFNSGQDLQITSAVINFTP